MSQGTVGSNANLCINGSDQCYVMSHEDTLLVAMKMCPLGYVGILDFSGYTEKYSIEAAH